MHAWFIEDGADSGREFAAAGSPNDLHWSLFLGATTVVDIYRYGRVPDTADDIYQARTWANGDTAPTGRGEILAGFWSGREPVMVRPSLDGKAGVFVLWQPLGSPLAALIGADGARVGAVRSLAPADHGLGNCPAVTPTQHGGLVSFVDLVDDSLRLTELGAESASPIETRYELPYRLPSVYGNCPVITLDGDGFAFLIPKSADDPAWELYRVARSGTVTKAGLTTRGRVFGVTALPQGYLVLEGDDSGPLLELLSDGGSQTFRLEPTLPTFGVFQGEPGSIFIDSQSSEPRELIQLGCHER